MLAFPLCATGTKNGGSNVAHRCPAEEYLHRRLLRARRERPRHCRGAAEYRDELATFQLIDLHSLRQPGMAAGYRIDGE